MKINGSRMARISLMTLSLFVIIVLSNCTSSKKQVAETADDFLWQWIDSTQNPGEDFFRWATGNWMKNNPIPESERRWGIANLVRDDIYEKLKLISEDAAADKNATTGSNTQKIGDFWAAGMDSAAIEKAGLDPLRPYLAKIDAISSTNELCMLIAEMQIEAGNPLFYPAIYQDEMNSEQYSLHLYQGGLGLPDREYYFKNDSRTSNIRNEYKNHLLKMFQLMGDDQAKAAKSRDAVLSIETSLAGASRKREELRDPYANYNKMSLSEISKLTPALPWKDILKSWGLEKTDTLIVGQPEFFKHVSSLITKSSLDDWKSYLRWNLVSDFASALSSDFDSESFRFYSTVMSGVKTQRPRWKRIIDLEESCLGDALGQLYVKSHVSPTMRARYDVLVQNMLDTYAEKIERLDWMTETTKKNALHKLRSINRKVCYPDKWKDYSTMTISRDSHVKNLMECSRWQFRYEVDKLYKPVDRNEWDMTPQTYNAYYNPSNNEIVLPAAQFLIPGIPDSLADDAIIYGYAAASTIGHELTHGFDDQGRQFDANGNLNNWWLPEDSVRFTQRAQLLIDQFNSYVILDSLHMNGEVSQGENIADLGGVVIGLEAFKKTDQFKQGKMIDGLSPVQRYFLGYTLGWLGHQRDESLALQVATGVHSPNFLRVNGPFSNVPEFYEAFGIKEGDKMWRADSLRVSIW